MPIDRCAAFLFFLPWLVACGDAHQLVPGRACPGAPHGDSSQNRCATSADCPVNRDYCSPDPNPIVRCVRVPGLCERDSDCDSDERCAKDANSSCGPSNWCVPRCPDTPCDENSVCDDDGACQPISCEDGFDCGPDMVCDPGSGANRHGCQLPSCLDGFECPVNTRCTAGSAAPNDCEPVSCSQDVDCDCGYCIAGACALELNFCSNPPTP